MMDFVPGSSIVVAGRGSAMLSAIKIKGVGSRNVVLVLEKAGDS